jgi:hypothetical protein
LIGNFTFASDFGNYPEEQYITILGRFLQPGENQLLLSSAAENFTGHWMVFDSLRFGQIKKAYYQWYTAAGTVGSGDKDRVVPSIDNAWFVLALMVIKQYAQEMGSTALVNITTDLLKHFDFRIWFNESTSRFSWGDVNEPLGEFYADYLSGENRVINYLAHTLGHITDTELINSLDALEQPTLSYENITVRRANWDGSYFTYIVPALFYDEFSTNYGVETIETATRSQIHYASTQSYSAWGISDTISPSNPTQYLDLGCPPSIGGYQDFGIITPHVSILALINRDSTLVNQALLNLENLRGISEAFHSQYGFLDSLFIQNQTVNPVFLTLDQEWILLGLANYKSNFLIDYYARNNNVANTMAKLRLYFESSSSSFTAPSFEVCYFFIGMVIFSLNNLLLKKKRRNKISEFKYSEDK